MKSDTLIFMGGKKQFLGILILPYLEISWEEWISLVCQILFTWAWDNQEKMNYDLWGKSKMVFFSMLYTSTRLEGVSPQGIQRLSIVLNPQTPTTGFKS